MKKRLLMLSMSLMISVTPLCWGNSNLFITEVAAQEFPQNLYAGAKAEEIAQLIAIRENPKSGYTTTRLNFRTKPSTNSKVIRVLPFNKKIKYTIYNDEWGKAEIGGETGYVYLKYISDKKIDYKSYEIPPYSGFKTYMDWDCITNRASQQYKLKQKAYVGNYGVCQYNGRYLVALGSRFNCKIGQYFDLVLENGTVIPCIMGDIKQDIHTDRTNTFTVVNGTWCCSEFIVNTSSMVRAARRAGDISKSTPEWDSPVAQIRIYQKNVME